MTELANVTATAEANVYFDGKVVSHAVVTAEGKKVTFGIIYPGTYHFGTEAPENMVITAGACGVKLAGSEAWESYAKGDAFDVPGDSSFDIAVEGEICQYICSFG